MSGIINRVPVGLLSILDMKSRGQAPRVLSGETQLGIDALEMYLQAGRRVASSSTAAVNIVGNFFQAGIGSPTEYLYVRKMSLRPAANLIGTYQVRGYIMSPEGFAVFVTSIASGAAGQRPTATSDEPFMLPPGWTYGVHCDVFSGTGGAWTVTFDYTPLGV